ncbi:MAG: sulfurtransferase TusA family protein [Nitrososphaerales archaeon]
MRTSLRLTKWIKVVKRQAALYSIMAEPRPEWVRADISIDLQGESCPIPEMTVAKRLKNLEPGKVIEVLTDHQPAADVTLPALANGLGYQFYAERSGDLYRVYITKQ